MHKQEGSVKDENRKYCFSCRACLLFLTFIVSLMMVDLCKYEEAHADSINITIDTNVLVLNLAPLSVSGDFAKSNDMNISVSTTSTSGYTLGIASSTGSTDLTNQSDNTKKINSISSPLSESDFSNSSNTQYNNKWGYKPSQYTTLDSGGHPTIHLNTNFRPLPGTTPEIIAKTECANGTAPCTNPTDTYTLSIGTRANNQTATGKYVSDTFIITAVTNKSVIPCDSTKLCVEYDGNGLSFPETSSQLPRTVNNVNYNSTTTSQIITKILHSDNVGDDGIATGNSDLNTDQTKETTIDGASSVNVSLYYDTEGKSYDWVALYAGANSVPSSTNDGNKGSNGNLTGKLGGNKSGYTTSYTTWNLWNNDGNPIDTDTIKIHFKTDNYGGSYISYGYYAIITSNIITYNRSVSSGEYSTPTGTNPVFRGWSTSQTTPGGGLPSDVEYANESEILAKMPGEEGETKTLYAVWQQGYPITFTMDSNVTKIDVLDSGGATVGTITSSGQTINLIQGNTYTLRPAYVPGYAPNTITKTSGAGTLNGKQFTVGAGSATLSVTSKVGGLYDFVAEQSKGIQTLAELRADITTSNSGVYEYNTSVFGTASDAANTSKIYYYRGILDNTTGSYGSDGDNSKYPNTVVLSSATSKGSLTTNDTCWRIVRTTGSGGVKMIYQGKWTGSTCANSEDNAQVTTQVFGLKGNSSQTYWYGNINRVGYTFNNTASIQDITTATSVDTVFGSNSSPSTNNARSNIKTYIEDTWYANNMTSYTSKLEASAGYCNDRTAFTNESGTSSMSTIPPYATSGTMYFGSYTRVANATSASTNRPSLTCPRSTVDLYRYVAGSTGVSNQLKYPAALLTADEAAFAGSGRNSSTTPYHNNSFLRSGSTFWLLSPSYRASSGFARGFGLNPDGYLNYYYVDGALGVRPSISLTSGTSAVSGTGTAADPWIVNP